MTRKYATPRYQKATRPGRKPLPQDQRRKTVSMRVAGETYNYLIKHGLKAGREIDRLVQKQLAEQVETPPANLAETGVDEREAIAELEARDTVLEMARGLVALLAERGTAHLSQEQIEMLDDNFTLIVNNFLATFKHNKQKFDI